MLTAEQLDALPDGYWWLLDFDDWFVAMKRTIPGEEPWWLPGAERFVESWELITLYDVRQIGPKIEPPAEEPQ